MAARGVAASSCAMSRPRSLKTPRIRRTREFHAVFDGVERRHLAALDLVERGLQANQDVVDALDLGELVRLDGGRRSGARDSSRASRSGGATKITVSLIGDGFGVPEGAESLAAAPRDGGLIDPVTARREWRRARWRAIPAWSGAA